MSGNYTLSRYHSRLSLPCSQLYSKVNKKIDDKQKPTINVNKSASTEKPMDLENTKRKYTLENNLENGIQRPWDELKERHFTLDEILSLETKNQVRFKFVFHNIKYTVTLSYSFLIRKTCQ